MNLAILVDASKYDEFPFLNEISTVFGIKPESIVVLYYHPDKKIALKFPEKIFTDTDLGFRGVLKNKSVSEYVNVLSDAF